MENRIAELETTVDELIEEVRGLTGDLRALQRRVGGTGDRGGRRSSEPAGGDSGEDQGEQAESEDFSLVGLEFDERGSRSRSGYTTPQGRSSSASSRCSLSWEEREAVCEEIAAWVRRCLNDNHRGPSGRDRISLPSRVWLVFRTISGATPDPVQVHRTFGSCKRAVKTGDSFGDSVFVGLPSDREAKRVVEFAGLRWPAN